MDIEVLSTWDEEQQTHVAHAIVDGRVADPFAGHGGYSRQLLIEPISGVMVKVDTDWFSEGPWEFNLWTSMDEDDREWFTPVHATGLCGCCGDRTWVAVEFMPDLTPIADLGKWEGLIGGLCLKYNLDDCMNMLSGDIYTRQMKMRPDGRPIIHDFGMNFLRRNDLGEHAY